MRWGIIVFLLLLGLSGYGRSTTGGSSGGPAIAPLVRFGLSVPNPCPAPCRAIADGYGSMIPNMEFGEYRVDWGETTGDVWTSSARPNASRDWDCCTPRAVHLYLTPGTYTARMSVLDSLGHTASANYSVTVTDPNSQWFGSDTTCVNPSGDNIYTGCPTGANQVHIGDPGFADYDDSLRSALGVADRRVLFKRGATYTANAAYQMNRTDSRIDAYGSGALPIVNVTYTGVYLTVASNTSRAQVMNMDFRGSFCSSGNCQFYEGTPTSGVADLLFYHNTITGFSGAFYENPVSDGSPLRTSYVENTLLNLAPAGTAVGGRNIAYFAWETIALGNEFTGQVVSHLVRGTGGQSLFMHNHWPAKTDTTFSIVVKFKIQGAHFDGSFCASHKEMCNNKHTVVGYNRIDSSNGPEAPFDIVVGIGSENHADPSFFEEVSQAHFEGNYLQTAGAAGTILFQEGANRTRFRRNIVDCTGTVDSCVVFDYVSDSLAESRQPNAQNGDVAVENVVYTSDNDSPVTLMAFTAESDRPVVQNNGIYCDSCASANVSTGSPTNATIDHNVALTSSTACASNPMQGLRTNGCTVSSSVADFRLATSDTLFKNAGTPTPYSRLDFDTGVRPDASLWDVGPFEQGSTPWAP